MKKILLILLFITYCIGLYGQEDSIKVNRPDTIPRVDKLFVVDTLQLDEAMDELNDCIRTAVEYLMSFYLNEKIWKDPDDPFRHALYRIAWYVINSPVDSTMKFLESYPYNNLNNIISQKDMIYGQQVRSLSDSTMETQIDTVKSGQLLDISDTTFIQQILADSILITDSLTAAGPDSVVTIGMEIQEPDTLLLQLDDSTFIHIGDSLRYAVNLLIEEIRKDSMLVWMMNLANDSTNVWVNKKGKSFSRFWLKNEVMDSIGLWMENVGRKGIMLTLDDGVYFKKFSRNKNIDNFKLEEEKPDSDLSKITPVVVKPVYWKLGAESGINFTQGYLSNWVKGGESSVSALGDFTSFANYTKNKTKWENNFRLKYGLMKTGEKGLRKNDDLWEINTKFGQKAFGKLGRDIMKKHGKESLKNWYYSFLISLKSQIAAGYNYPNDSVIVSSFMSPGHLFFVLGLDYKPGKTTSLLISPITSKLTIVRDTINIDQTKYGLDPDRKIKSEMGGYVKAKFLLKISDDISLDNNLTLFTNYLENPQNIDIDWEATLKMRINYYINANISTHLIYDDNIEVPLFNDEGTKIGSGPRVQFKELISVGFTFKLL
ncbi:MAG: DUF3078 domain-containing protein [Bacteroidetes bacterium]|nr:DUF3078 domain-containing protein [Bacteroidota bacterium]